MDLTDLQRIAAVSRDVRDRIQTGTARAIRIQAGVTQAQMAAAVGGIDESTVSRWENGNRRPRGATAERWLRVLDQLAGVDQQDIAA